MFIVGIFTVAILEKGTFLQWVGLENLRWSLTPATWANGILLDVVILGTLVGELHWDILG